MCGLAGVLRIGRGDAGGDLAALAQSMASALEHRGPDDQGVWCDAQAGIGFGFRRLSVLDLSEQGHQPMVSHCGRYQLVYNGEIYNHQDLRKALDAEGAVQWRGHSDSEVLAACLSAYGVEATLPRLNGMFAFAAWDTQERTLWMARDRFGEKPLYYSMLGSDFVFASEARALFRHPLWHGEIDTDALRLFLRYGYVPSPRSAWKGIHKLRPGYCLRASARGVCEPHAYWDIASVAAHSAENAFEGSFEDAIDCVSDLLDDAVARRGVADVPLGAFLSGGIDSSAVVASMAAGGQDVRTFSIGFDDPRYDEAGFAADVAQHLGTLHTSVTATADDCLGLVDRLNDVYGEPFADASQIPTLLLCEMTRQHVTVSLSGDGGDELFGGYPRYRDAPGRWERVRNASSGVRAAARIAARALSGGHGRFMRKLRRPFADYDLSDRQALFRARVSHWESTDTRPDADSVMNAIDTATIREHALAFMVFDAATYLPDDLQVKMDRASMSVSLEARAPLLDHRLAEFAWRLPESMTVRAPGKRVLREVLYRRVPRALVDRPKRGFEPPIADWLRGPLRERAESYFSSAHLENHGLINPKHVAQRWREHKSGRNRGHALWNVFVLGAWMDTQGK